jgi:ribosome maturation factor RimP
MAVDLERIRQITERVVSSEGLTLFDLEGVSHADCQLVSEQLSAILDVEDPIPGSYVLEVSSPGLNRLLVKPSDFTYFAGRRARLVLREPVGTQRVIEGKLAGFEDGRVRMELEDAGISEFELSNISKAKLVVEL